MWIPNPSGTVKARAEAAACMAAYMLQTDYVMRADGSVWAWRYEVYAENVFSLASAVAPAMLGGMFEGLVIIGQSRTPPKLSILPDSVNNSRSGEVSNPGE